MATATVQNVQEQVAALEAEVSELKGRLSAEEKDLAALEQEQTRVGERIALGQEKPSKAGEIARHIEQVEARVSGLRSILARKQAELDHLWPERRRLEAEATLARRRSELEALTKRGREHVAALNGKLAALITSDLVELDRIRDEMMPYKDIGGQQAGAVLCSTLIDSNGALAEERKLTDNRNWQKNPVIWKMRGDVVLTLRNLWPPKR